MKRLFSILFAVLLIASCSKDDEVTCTAEQFAGSYKGVEKCTSLGSTDNDYTATFTAGTSSNKVVFSDDFRTYDLTISGCKATYSDLVFNSGIVIEFIRADDGSLSGSVVTKSLGVNIENCTITLTK